MKTSESEKGVSLELKGDYSTNPFGKQGENRAYANLRYFVDPLLRLSIKYDSEHDLWWRLGKDNLFEALVPCNDFFWWGVADAEEIMVQEIPALEKAYENCDAAGDLTQFWGGSLFVARKRKMRPQGSRRMV